MGDFITELLIYIGGYTLLLLLFGLVLALKSAVERRAWRRGVQRLLLLDTLASSREWSLPAPESYALFRGVEKVKSDGFKLGLLQLIAMGVMEPEGSEAPEAGGGDTALMPGPAPACSLSGSLLAVHRLCGMLVENQSEEGEDPVVADHTTVKEVARQAHENYGSLDRFVDQVVVPELLQAGLYGNGRLLPAGEAARADLEARMAVVLREMRQRQGSWVEKQPRQALLGAVLAVALGQRRLPEETQQQLVGEQVEQIATMAVAPQGTASYYSDMRFQWLIYHDFDRYFGMVDSGVDAGGGPGDGDDGGGGGDGGGGE